MAKRSKKEPKDHETLLLAIYKIINPWVLTGGYASVPNRMECQDWINDVNLALGDQRKHLRENANDNTSTVEAWCDEVTQSSETPMFQHTDKVNESTCLACLKAFRAALCAQADESMSESFVVAARESELKSVAKGEAPKKKV